MPQLTLLFPYLGDGKKPPVNPVMLLMGGLLVFFVIASIFLMTAPAPETPMPFAGEMTRIAATRLAIEGVATEQLVLEPGALLEGGNMLSPREEIEATRERLLVTSPPATPTLTPTPDPLYCVGMNPPFDNFGCNPTQFWEVFGENPQVYFDLWTPTATVIRTMTPLPPGFPTPLPLVQVRATMTAAVAGGLPATSMQGEAASTQEIASERTAQATAAEPFSGEAGSDSVGANERPFVRER